MLVGPKYGVELGYWQDLTRWGVDLSAENPQEVQTIQNDELRQRVQFVMKTDMKGRVSLLTEELASWYAQGKAESKLEGIALGRVEGKAEGKAEGKEEILKTMLGNGASVAYLARLTGLEIGFIKKLEASMSA